MTRARAHVVGAGLAGLAAAVGLVRHGFDVELHEAAAHAGGRCRSYHDRELDLVIDNGNHLVLSGNRAVNAYLAVIGAADRLTGPAAAAFPYVDLRDGARWMLRPNAGPLAWWVFDPTRRPPGTRARDYLALARLIRPSSTARIADVIAMRGPLWERMLQNFLVAALNTEPAEASAGLAAAVVRETLVRGGAHYRPRVATPTLSAAFVDPALAWLAAEGAAVRLGRRLRSIEFGAGRAARLAFADATLDVGPRDAVILATPPAVTRDLLPGLIVPDAFRAILNAHFRLAPPPNSPLITGIVGGLAEWVFAFPDRVSVTVSAADRWMEHDRADLAARLWRDASRALGCATELPRWQVVKERRATFAATPAQDARRPGAGTRWDNLWLAGDWTATGLPATIEGALRSGARAADLASARR